MGLTSGAFLVVAVLETGEGRGRKGCPRHWWVGARMSSYRIFLPNENLLHPRSQGTPTEKHPRCLLVWSQN